MKITWCIINDQNIRPEMDALSDSVTFWLAVLKYYQITLPGISTVV